MTCPASPGHCLTCNRRVRWADIQTCRFLGAPEVRTYETTSATSFEGVSAFSGARFSAPEVRTCRDCIHQGDPVLAPNGKQVGSEGCGCTSASVPSGVLWWTCNLTEKPARESRAEHCENFQRKDTSDAAQ